MSCVRNQLHECTGKTDFARTVKCGLLRKKSNNRRYLVKKLLLMVMALAVIAPSSASAFCGFYVAPGDAKLVNKATRVALMRHGTKTVMSLQPDYEGPAEGFAMVIPVPQVLQKEDVKTLDRSLFDTLDEYTSPRMSEYWEQDPCPRPVKRSMRLENRNYPSSMAEDMAVESSAPEKPFVKIEAKFAVAEYDILVLSSNDGTALESWLTDRKYKIPKGAAPYLAPYINSGMYFFVAKVDPKRAKFKGNQAILSPLRFHYTSEDFTLPIRLGMINADGEQDIVVFVLGEERFVPANYPHAPIPTNIVVKDKVRENFAQFYEGLFAKTRKENEDAIITEYVWELATIQSKTEIGQGYHCDPCTSTVTYFTPEWLVSLGLDVFGVGSSPESKVAKPLAAGAPKKLVVTRLHGRFKPDLKNPDIVFQKATPLFGGMGTPDQKGRLEATKYRDAINMFQGRYILLNKWKGEALCKSPQYGNWGGPPNGGAPTTKGKGASFGKKSSSLKPESYVRGKINYSPPAAAK
jgi:hypothetical protein